MGERVAVREISVVDLRVREFSVALNYTSVGCAYETNMWDDQKYQHRGKQLLHVDIPFGASERLEPPLKFITVKSPAIANDPLTSPFTDEYPPEQVKTLSEGKDEMPSEEHIPCEEGEGEAEAETEVDSVDDNDADVLAVTDVEPVDDAELDPVDDNDVDGDAVND